MTETSQSNSEEVCVDCAPSTSEPTGQAKAESSSSNETPPSQTDPTMISAPKIPTPSITIEFCDRCRWAPRATWIQTELFLTFPTPHIRSITLIPLTAPETGGRFRVWVDRGNGGEMVWDRKIEGGFPELKVLKQRVRDMVQPDMGLGHSDGHKKTEVTSETTLNSETIPTVQGV